MNHFIRIATIVSLVLFSHFAHTQEDVFEAKVDVVVKEIIKLPSLEEKVQRLVGFNNELRDSLSRIPRQSDLWANTNELITYLDQVEEVGEKKSCTETLRLLNSLGALEQRAEFIEGKSKVAPLAIQARRLLRAICLK